jgi:hypothetical protein
VTLHYYSELERRQHLQNLVDALAVFIPALEKSKHYADRVIAFQQALVETKRLLAESFVQEDLSNLSRNVPKLFWLHKDWQPPLESFTPESGRIVEPEWFKQLEPLELSVSEAAEKLRVVGEY